LPYLRNRIVSVGRVAGLLLILLALVREFLLLGKKLVEIKGDADIAEHVLLLKWLPTSAFRLLPTDFYEMHQLVCTVEISEFAGFRHFDS
jgi:hypothetical protein